MGTKHVLMWSGGKDSTASGIIAKLNGFPVDRIITVMPDPFKGELELKEKFEDWMHLKVEIVDGPKFEDFFYRVKVRGVNKGGIYGWPKLRQKVCARMLKWEPQKKWHTQNPGYKAIVGISADEMARLTGVESKNDVSYLALEGVTQERARSICEEHGLLSPLYDHFTRTGCVRCSKQGKKALCKVRELEPEKWEWMLKQDKISPVPFNPGRTLHDIMGINNL